MLNQFDDDTRIRLAIKLMRSDGHEDYAKMAEGLHFKMLAYQKIAVKCMAFGLLAGAILGSSVTAIIWWFNR